MIPAKVVEFAVAGVLMVEQQRLPQWRLITTRTPVEALNRWFSMGVEALSLLW
jgi:hypothetical protein